MPSADDLLQEGIWQKRQQRLQGVADQQAIQQAQTPPATVAGYSAANGQYRLKDSAGVMLATPRTTGVTPVGAQVLSGRGTLDGLPHTPRRSEARRSRRVGGQQIYGWFRGNIIGAVNTTRRAEEGLIWWEGPSEYTTLESLQASTLSRWWWLEISEQKTRALTIDFWGRHFGVGSGGSGIAVLVELERKARGATPPTFSGTAELLTWPGYYGMRIYTITNTAGQAFDPPLVEVGQPSPPFGATFPALETFENLPWEAPTFPSVDFAARARFVFYLNGPNALQIPTFSSTDWIHFRLVLSVAAAGLFPTIRFKEDLVNPWA